MTTMWTIRRRFYVIAVITTIAVFAPLAGTLNLIGHYEKIADHLVKQELPSLRSLASTFSELASIHTILFSLIQETESKIDEQTLYLRGREIMERLDRLVTSVSTQSFSLDGNNHNVDTVRQQLLVELSQYRASVSTSIEMLTVNLGLTKRYLLNASASFNVINSLLAELARGESMHVENEIAEQIEPIQQLYRPITIGIVLISIVFVFLFYRLILFLLRQFVFIESSLDALREGDTSLALPTIHHDDEIGRVVQALRKFQTSLTELNASKQEILEKNKILIEESEQRAAAQRELVTTMHELSIAKDAAEAASKAKSLFLANISHELRTPLSAIIGMNDLMMIDEHPPQQEEQLETVSKSANHLLGLVSNLLEYVSNETNTNIEIHTFDPSELTRGLARTFETLAMQKNISFKTYVSNNLPDKISGDINRITQILHQLLSNAIKFSDHGTIHFSIVDDHRDDALLGGVLCDATPIITSMRPCEKARIAFIVRDEGKGIPESLHQYIFGVFTQADESFTRQHGGIGFGLAITKQLVELLRGDLFLKSSPKQGSTFVVRFCLD